MRLRLFGLALVSEVETLRAALHDSDERVIAAQGQAGEAIRALADMERDLHYVRRRIQALGPEGTDNVE